MEEVAEDILGNMDAPQDHPTDLQGSETVLKWWYRNASVCQPKLSRADLEKVYIDYAVLYQREASSPPGQPPPIQVATLPIENNTPIDAYVEAEEIKLKSHKDGGHIYLHAKKLKE